MHLLISNTDYTARCIACQEKSNICSYANQKTCLTPFISPPTLRVEAGEFWLLFVKWNFTKFVIDRDGNVVARFEPTADMAEVEACIKSLL